MFTISDENSTLSINDPKSSRFHEKKTISIETVIDWISIANKYREIVGDLEEEETGSQQSKEEDRNKEDGGGGGGPGGGTPAHPV